MLQHNEVQDSVVSVASGSDGRGDGGGDGDNDKENTTTEADEAQGTVGSVFIETRDDRGNTLTVTDEVQVKADDIVNLYETPQTKLLTNEQLQRIVLLQQLNVLDLQRKKLECDAKATTIVNNIDFELIGFNACDPMPDVIEQ